MAHKKTFDEQMHQNIVNCIKNFRLLDDDFMTKCFEENIEATELVVRIILDKPDIKVEKVQTQYTMKNIIGRSLRLDIYATDSAGNRYNIEIQRADKGAGAKRARYNSSLIDGNILPIGVDVNNLTDTYVIFITENDVLGGNKPIYHIDRYIRETGEYFSDGSHIIYVNASFTDDSELGKLMQDFNETNPDKMNYNVLKEAVIHYKKTERGEQSMCRAFEELLNKENQKNAMRFLELGVLSNEQIANALDLDIEVVKTLAEELAKKQQK